MSSESMDLPAATASLIDAGRRLYARGWLPATSGNLSARLSDGRVAITVSGRCKGSLDDAAIMCLDREGHPLDGRRPSAETGLHLQLYRTQSSAGVVLHTHSLTATLLSESLAGDWRLAGLEILKAFPGVATHEAEVVVPVFDNDQDIERLARAIEPRLDSPAVPGYLLRGHGLYVWGDDMAAAMRHLEALEYLARYSLARSGYDTIDHEPFANL